MSPGTCIQLGTNHFISNTKLVTKYVLNDYQLTVHLHLTYYESINVYDFVLT